MAVKERRYEAAAPAGEVSVVSGDECPVFFKASLARPAFFMPGNRASAEASREDCPRITRMNANDGSEENEFYSCRFA